MNIVARHSLLLTSIFCLLWPKPSIAQCPTLQFDDPPAVCLGETFQLNNVSNSSGNYVWDFCDGDLFNQPTAQSVKQVMPASSPTGLDFIEADGQYFLFVTGRVSNNLVRVDFGPDPENPDPIIVDLGSLQGMLKAPIGITLLKEQGSWYGMVYNSGSDSLARINFGGSLTNAEPTVTNVAKGFASNNNNSALTVGVSNDNVVAVLTNPATNKITLVNFGNTVLNTPNPTTDILVTNAIPGASSLRGISLHQTCGQWYGFTVAYTSKKIYRLEFGTELFSSPNVVDITGSYANPENFQDIQIHYNAGTYVGFILTAQGPVYRLDFGSTITGLPEAVNIGNLGAIASAVRFVFHKTASTWKLFSCNTGTRYIYRADFPDNCSALQPSSDGFQPIENSYNQPGTYNITMVFEDGLTGSSYVTKQIIVEDKQAPMVDLVHSGLCVGHDVNFTISTDAGLLSVQWNFGDGDMSTGQSVTHQYATAGEYIVQAAVQSENGCNNYTYEPITTYDLADANFSVSASPLCTGNPITFTNQTPDIYDGNLAYQWLVDNAPVTTARDLQYTFPDTGPKDITLITSIPGCSSEITKTTDPLQPGPNVDFSFSGTCEDEQFAFRHDITDPFESLSWNFGNGETSSALNPFLTYADFGNYEVTLTATNAVGCENTKKKTVAVRARPLAAFAVEGPPNSCTDVNTSFENTSTNPDGRLITEWLWDFGDAADLPTSSDLKATHRYSAAGNYDVSLTATTEDGCASTFQQEVFISQAPPATYSSGPTCEDLPVQFSGETSADIVDWYWEIGTSYYHTASPLHTFAAPGDYLLLLETESANGCRSARSATVHVPEPLQPDFTYIRNCVGQETNVYDVTTGTDPVVSGAWDFGDGFTVTGSEVRYSFPEVGTYDVTLRVATAAGCVYEVIKPLNVVPAPVASFVANPAAGAWPLEVTFTNQSAGATKYRWDFGHDDATSAEPSPTHVFPGPGNSTVTLTAVNNEQCEDSFSRSISTVDPLPDIDIERITPVPTDDGSVKLVVTLHNKGNTVVKDLALDFNFAGKLSLRDAVSQAISPGDRFNFVLSTGITDAITLGYVCITAELAGDVSVAANRRCLEFDRGLILLPAYPNPSPGVVTLEWIAAESNRVDIFLTDAIGRLVDRRQVQATEGLNQQALDLTDLKNGVYFFTIEAGSVRSTQRILLLNNP